MERYKHTGNRNTDTVIEGILEIERRFTVDSSIREAQIRELAISLFRDENDPDQALALISEIKSGSGLFRNVNECIVLCRELLGRYGDRLELRTGAFNDKSKTVAVLNNGYMERAFESFCDLDRLERVYYSGFEELCESVSAESCDCAIVPIENSENGKLLRFYSLIDRYDLKINAVCDVSYVDESASTRYALVSKNLSAFADPDCFEFSISLESDQSINDVLFAASLCHMRLVRIDSIELPYKDKEFAFHVVFDLQGADLQLFMLYMTLSFPQYIPIGIFKKVK
ncbi:MAG: hypothetical protein IJX46_09125 [Clostridia bacterium]|nr:hypothetical protein [Clostridia bacterium]